MAYRLNPNYITATSDGLGKGLVSDKSFYLYVTSSSSTNKITLPESSSIPLGWELKGKVESNGFQLQTSVGSNEKINGIDSDGSNVQDVGSDTYFHVIHTSENEFLLLTKDSSGSDSYVNHGFADYNDTSTASTPLTLLDDTWTTLPNDGLGAFSQEKLPSNVDTLLGVGGAIDITDLAIGSDILIRPDFTVTPTSNNSALSFRFSLGSGGSAYTLEQQLGRLDLGAGIPYRFALQALYIYAGDSNTRDNPINLQVKLSGGGTLVNAGMAIKVYSK